MKCQVLIIVFFSFSSLKMYSQPIFKVVETSRDYINKEVKISSQKKYYRIKFAHDSSNISYPVSILPDGFDTIKAIKELLNLEGDTRLSSLPITNYNPLSSQLYMGSCKDYSIQVEALFIINQLILKKPFNYSAYPILVNRSTNKEASISGPIIKNAFQAYKDWLKKITKNGLGSKLSEEMMPLYDSPVKWY